MQRDFSNPKLNKFRNYISWVAIVAVFSCVLLLELGTIPESIIMSVAFAFISVVLSSFVFIAIAYDEIAFSFFIVGKTMNPWLFYSTILFYLFVIAALVFFSLESYIDWHIST